MRLATYLRFCALLALVVLATAQPRTRREREAEQAAAADAATQAPRPGAGTAMRWGPGIARTAEIAAEAAHCIALTACWRGAAGGQRPVGCSIAAARGLAVNRFAGQNQTADCDKPSSGVFDGIGGFR